MDSSTMPDEVTQKLPQQIREQVDYDQYNALVNRFGEDGLIRQLAEASFANVQKPKERARDRASDSWLYTAVTFVCTPLFWFWLSISPAFLFCRDRRWSEWSADDRRCICSSFRESRNALRQTTLQSWRKLLPRRGRAGVDESERSHIMTSIPSSKRGLVNWIEGRSRLHLGDGPAARRSFERHLEQDLLFVERTLNRIPGAGIGAD